MAAKGQKLDLVVVDYLQLMDADKDSDNRVQEITRISRGLKSAALANDVGIIALAQLSRKVEEREEKRPKLSDLRESGSIEQDADGVLFLYRQDYYLKQTEPPEDHERREKWEAAMNKCAGDIEFICAKRRQGETGIRHGRFYGCFQAVR
jgi:replicative DNA helicase